MALSWEDAKGMLGLAIVVVSLGGGIWSVVTDDDQKKTPDQVTPCERSRAIAEFFYAGAQESARNNRPQDYVAAMDTTAETIVDSPECFQSGQVEGARRYLDQPESSP